MALLEAMAQGRPAVATSVGGVPGVLRGCGIVARPGDLKGRSAAVVTLLRTPELAATLGRRGHERLKRPLHARPLHRELPRVDRRSESRSGRDGRALVRSRGPRSTRVIDARLGRPPRDAIEAAIVLEAWDGRPAARALSAARDWSIRRRQSPAVKGRPDSPDERERTSVLAEAVALVLSILSVAASAGPLGDALGTDVLKDAISYGLPTALALQWALRSRYLGLRRPGGLALLAHEPAVPCAASDPDRGGDCPRSLDGVRWRGCWTPVPWGRRNDPDQAWLGLALRSRARGEHRRARSRRASVRRDRRAHGEHGAAVPGGGLDAPPAIRRAARYPRAGADGRVARRRGRGPCWWPTQAWGGECTGCALRSRWCRR